MPRRAFPDPGSWYFHLIEEKIAPEGDVTEQWKVASKAFTHSLLSRTLAKPMVSHVRHAGPFVASYLFCRFQPVFYRQRGLAYRQVWDRQARVHGEVAAVVSATRTERVIFRNTHQ